MTMRDAKRKRLIADGWRVGGIQELLNLSDAETAYIEIRVRLAESLREKRYQRRLGQIDLAKLLKSSQSRVAKMEAGDRSVSLDLLIRSLLALGISYPELGDIIARSRFNRARRQAAKRLIAFGGSMPKLRYVTRRRIA
jgi:transcriptional regulator with XRE-family HTH domain